MKQLTQRQRRNVAKFNRKVKKNQAGFKKHSMKVNSSSLGMWLRGHGIETPVKNTDVLIRIVKRDLYDNIDWSPEPPQALFGVGLASYFDELALVAKIKRAIKRHKVAVDKKSRVADLQKSYREMFGKPAPKDVSEAWLKNVIRVGPLKPTKFETGGFQSRQRTKHMKRSNPGHLERNTGCALDVQAKELGIYDKEFTVNVTRKVKNKETGLNEKVVIDTITKPYKDLSRKYRKRLNHLAYKEAA